MLVSMHDDIYNDIKHSKIIKIPYLAALQHTQKAYIITFTISPPLQLLQGGFKNAQTI